MIIENKKSRDEIQQKLLKILPEEAITIIRNLDVPAYIVGTNREILLWNSKSSEITGFLPEEVEGTGCHENILRHVDDNGTELCLNECPLAKTLKDGLVRRARVYLRHKLGYRMPIRIQVLPLYSRGKIQGAIEFFLEDTEELTLLEELRKAREKALICPLTEIGNRRFCELTLEDRLQEMKRLNSHLGLFFIDIDNFKHVNDTYGHTIGDIVLKMVARTLVNIMRPYDFVGRWGGEEFIVIVPHLRYEDLLPLGNRMRKLIEASKIKRDQGGIGVTISIGACLSQPHDTVESIIARADKIMYEAKQKGKNCVVVEHENLTTQ